MKNKNYEVRIDLVWAQVYKVKAVSAKEAKKLALQKFKNRLPKKDITVDAMIVKP
jgi:hypothetical protein